MRIYSFVYFIVALLVFGLYFGYINVILKEYLLIRFLIFLSLFSVLRYLFKRFDGRFAFMEKRFDKRLSPMIIFCIICIALFVG